MSDFDKRFKIFSVIDVILFPKKEDRSFRYDNSWGKNKSVCFITDGTGSEGVYWNSGKFEAYRCFIPELGIMKELNEVMLQHKEGYEEFHNEEKFSIDKTSAIWYWDDDECSDYGLDVSGLFNPYDLVSWGIEKYHSWLEKQCGKKIDIETLKQLFEERETLRHMLNLKPFEMKFALDLNPDVDIDSLVKDLNVILNRNEFHIDYIKEYLD